MNIQVLGLTRYFCNQRDDRVAVSFMILSILQNVFQFARMIIVCSGPQGKVSSLKHGEAKCKAFHMKISFVCI